MSDDKREAMRKKLLAQRDVEDYWLNGGEVEVGSNYGTGWVDATDPVFLWHNYLYRKKPKPLEGWVNIYNDSFGTVFKTKAEAERVHFECGRGRVRIIKIREVVE